MDTAELNPLYNIFEPTDTFDYSLDLYYRNELDARYEYLIETSKQTQNWTTAHTRELSALQYLLYKVPQSANGITHIVAERYRHEYCKNLIGAFICVEDDFVSKYIDIDAIARNVANDMPRIEVNGHVFYWFNRSDL